MDFFYYFVICCKSRETRFHKNRTVQFTFFLVMALNIAIATCYDSLFLTLAPYNVRRYGHEV